MQQLFKECHEVSEDAQKQSEQVQKKKSLQSELSSKSEREVRAERRTCHANKFGDAERLATTQLAMYESRHTLQVPGLKRSRKLQKPQVKLQSSTDELSHSMMSDMLTTSPCPKHSCKLSAMCGP